MIESNGVNTSLSPYNYNLFATDSAFFHEVPDTVVRQENLELQDDWVTLSCNAQSVTANNRTLTPNIPEGDGFDLLRGLVLNIFTKQGVDSVIATDGSMVDAASLSQKEAQEFIAEDGYFGVEKTSERIFQFAIGAAGGDPARLDAIRLGVENGFEEALDVFSGLLPDISFTTCDAVINKLDDWAGVNTSQTIGNQVIP